MPHAIVTYIISLTSIPPWEIIRYMVQELDDGQWMCMSFTLLGWLGATTIHGWEILTWFELSFFQGICFLGGVEGFFFQSWVGWDDVKWGLGIFLFQGRLFLHIWGVFWVGRCAIFFPFQRGFFLGGVGRVWLFLKGGRLNLIIFI